jgi:predicted patatin/cPLA2 family phospholipase
MEKTSEEFEEELYQCLRSIHYLFSQDLLSTAQRNSLEKKVLMMAKNKKIFMILPFEKLNNKELNRRVKLLNQVYRAHEN